MVLVSADITPFKGRNVVSTVPTRLIRRFAKAGRVVEIHERTLISLKAVEFVILVDRTLRESQMFHGRRLQEYAVVLAIRVKQLTDHGWIEQSVDVELGTSGA
jgi:hypothetical protein